MKPLKILSIASIFSVTLIASSFAVEQQDTFLLGAVNFSRNVLKLYKSGILEGIDADEIAQDFLSKYPAVLENIAQLGCHICKLEGKLHKLKKQSQNESKNDFKAISKKPQKVENSSIDIQELDGKACVDFSRYILELYKDAVLEGIDVDEADEIAQDFLSKYPKVIENLEETGHRIKNLQEAILQYPKNGQKVFKKSLTPSVKHDLDHGNSYKVFRRAG